MALHANQHDREDHQHQDVQRQDVEKGRLELEEERLDYGDMRFIEEIGDPHLLIVHGVIEGRDSVGHFGNKDYEQEDVRDIELPSATQHLGGGVDHTLFDEPAPVDQGRREAGDENENFCRVEKTKCLECKIAEDVLRNVINKDKDQRQASEEIQAEIA